MNALRVELLHFNPKNLRNNPLFTPIKPRFNPSTSASSKSKSRSSNISKHPNKTRTKIMVKLAASLKSKTQSRTVMVGAVSVGISLLLMGIEGEKAMALGPLMEEFWDNMRRYGLYALTVSTGAI